jgi:hypothetical protein
MSMWYPRATLLKCYRLQSSVQPRVPTLFEVCQVEQTVSVRFTTVLAKSY